ncbi:thialysine N-epsilon-acetyltransferase-like [Argopecten irradians]|uniref:thialysine N-epsilon-acetyltransferase-like n=1 Tax=Argopecten irradians TaxID=31199 RepID=UPI0037125A9D
MEEYTIRPAVAGDCEEILRLRQEMSVYNRNPSLQMTADRLRKDGFGEWKWFECIVVEDKKMRAQDQTFLWGYALYFYIYTTSIGRTIFLEDIFLSEQYRGSGVGSKLFSQVAQIGLAQDCQILKWEVYNWNTASIEFYKKRGAYDVTETTDLNVYQMNRLELEQLAKSH